MSDDELLAAVLLSIEQNLDSDAVNWTWMDVWRWTSEASLGQDQCSYFLLPFSWQLYPPWKLVRPSVADFKVEPAQYGGDKLEPLRERLRAIERVREGRNQDIAGLACEAFDSFPEVSRKRIDADPFLARWRFRVDRYIDLIEQGPYDYFVTFAPCRKVPDSLLVDRFNHLMALLNRDLFGSAWLKYEHWLLGTVVAEQLSKSSHSGLHFHMLLQAPTSSWVERPSVERLLEVAIHAAAVLSDLHGERPVFNAGSISVSAVDPLEPLASYLTKELTERDGAAADLLYDLKPKGIDWIGSGQHKP